MNGNETNREKVLEKLRKLHAMAESAREIGSEEEAQAFASKVQQLLTSYKLSQSDLGQHREAPVEEPINIYYVKWEELGEDFTGRTARAGWAEQLALIVARAYYCDFLITRTYAASFVGAETDRKICVYMFVTIARFLHKLADREMHLFWVKNTVDGKLPDHCKGFRHGFLTGFIQRLAERFEEEIRPKENVDNSSVTAIVLVRKNSLARIKDWEHRNLQMRTGRMASVSMGNSQGRARGRQCANDLNLNQRPVSGGKPNGQLGGGQ